MRISAFFNKLSTTGAGWKATALVCALVLTACGKGGAGTGASGANAQPSFSYATNPAYYQLNSAITANTLNISNAATSYSISPSLPTGLSFSAANGTISGTPTVSSAATSYTVTGHNPTGTNFATVTIGTGAVGTISYGGSLSFEQGTSVGTVTPTVSGGFVSSCSISPALPAGLSFNTSNCAITGTPTTNQGSTPYTITPTYGSPVSGTNPIVENITITTVAPSVSFPGDALSFEEGTSVGTQSPTVTNGPVTTCTLTSGSMPAGLSMDSGCNITGTPTASQVSTNYTVTASNVHGTSAPYLFTITIASLPPTLVYPSGGALSFIQSISVGTVSPTVTNGPVSSCSISPSIPSGLTFNTSTCVITGTPTGTQAVTSYSVTASNVHGSSPNAITITIQSLPPNLTYSPNSQTGTYGVAITTMTPTNSGGPISGCSASPSLPAGLSLSPTTCAISGTPSAINGGATPYTITPSGSGGTGSGVTVTLTINDATPAISFTNPYTVTDNVTITAINATRTAGSTVTSCAASSLPTGLSVAAVGGTCQITGKPVGPISSASYTITPTNSAATGAGATVTINVVEQAPNIAFAGSPFNFTLNSSVGAGIVSTNSAGGNLTTCTSSPALPGGLSIAVATSAPGTNNICQITGTPNTSQPATNYNVTASNSAGNSTATISIAVSTGGAPNISYAGSPFTWNAGPVVGNPVTLTPANTGGVISSCAISPSPPGGISFSTTTCVLSGTPTVGVAQAATNYTITATNASGSSSATISVAITTVPVISYPGSPYTFTKGTAISTVTPTNTGSAATTCTSGTWGPSGLTLNADCSISGTPTALIASPGTTYSIANSNADGSGTAASVTIIVNDAAPTLVYSPTTYTFNKNVAGSATPTVGGGAITTCTSSPTLPTGLSIPVASTCKITGTPTVFAASQTYTITASNTGGSASENLTIAVTDAIPAISYAGTPFTFKVGTSIGVSGATTLGGGAVTSCSVSPALPTGLSMDTACNITGTPTVGQNATNYTVSATNSGGTQNLNISIAVNSKPVISYLPSSYTYTKGVAITALSPTNAGFSAITSCTIAPNINTNTGLTFSAVNCQISGTPTSISGATVYTVTPTNGVGTGTAATVTIAVDDAVPTLSFSPTTYTFNKNVAASATPTVGGGAITTCTSSPTLPAGLSIPVASTCQITGTPTAYASSQSYTITASNTGGSASQILTIAVDDAIPAISYSTPFSFNINTSIGTTGQPTLGGGAVTSCAVAPALPAGLSIDTACNITGTPTVLQNATSYTVSATNSGGTQNVGISIAVITVPVLTYAGPYAFGNGVAITTVTPTNTGSPATSCSSTPNLTAATGLTLNTDCSISGTPTTAVAAANYSITGTNADGTSAAVLVNIAVVNSPAISYSPTTETFTLRTAISAWNASNTGGAATSCLSSPTLPSGLALSPTTCDITGTPTGTSPSTSYTITATNSAGSSNATITIKVLDQPEILFYSFMNTSGSWNGGAEKSQNAFQVTEDGKTVVALTANNGTTNDEYDTIFPSWLSTAGASGAGQAIFASLTAASGLWNGAANSSFNIWSVAEGGGTLSNLASTNTASSTQGASTLAADGVASPYGVVSPDGTKIAFASLMSSGGVTSSSMNIWIMNINGTGVTNLTNITGTAGMDCLNPVWDPTSSIIYFQSKLNQGDTITNFGGPANLSYNIWSIDTGATTLTRITNETSGVTERDCVEPSVSPDGNYLAYSSKSRIGATTANSFNIWYVPSSNVKTNGTALTKSTTAGMDSVWPEFSNTTTGTGFGGYYAITFQSKMGTTTTMTGGNDSSTVTWNGTASSSNNVWTATSWTGTPVYTYLTSNTAASLDSVTPVFAPDDSKIIFGSKMNVGGNSSACYNIWTMSVTGGSQSNVTANTSSGLDSYLATTSNVMYIAQ